MPFWGEATTSTAVTAAVAAEAAARSSADGAEVTARNSAISTAIGTEVTDRNTAIGVETTNRGNDTATRAIKLTNAAVVTAAGPTVIAANTIVPTDTTSNAVGITLPSAPADGTRIIVKQVVGAVNATTITRGGTDVFNVSGGTTTKTLTLTSQAISLQYTATGGIWYVTSDDLPLSGLDARYVPQTTTVNGHALSGNVTVTATDAGAPTALTRATPVTAAGPTTVAINTIVPVDTTSNAVGLTLPTAPAEGSRVAVKHIIQGGTNAVTITCGGSDVFNKATGPTTKTLTLLNQAVNLQYTATGAIWTVTAEDQPLSNLDARYVPTVEVVNTVAASGAAQTIAEPAVKTINDITLTAACTLTFPTATPGTSFTLFLRQGGAGSFTVTWPTVKWSSGAAPVLSTAVGALDTFSFVYVTAWNGFVAGLAMA
jgi:hypothetical protein